MPSLKDAAEDESRRAAAETAAAIAVLGNNPAVKQVAAIVFKAVRSSPGSVLPVVHAATLAAPAVAVPDIVNAATAALPNPWKRIVYRRFAADMLKKSQSDFKGTVAGGRGLDFRGREPDFKGGRSERNGRDPSLSGQPGTFGDPSQRGAFGDPSQRGTFGDPSQGGAVQDTGANSGGGYPMTLAEAIVQTAFDARPGLSLSALQSAVDSALLAAPATLLRNIQSPRTVSGVGDAGGSNYANEPLRSRVSTGTPVPAPNQPVVSR